MGKIQEITDFIRDFDLVVLQETWIEEKDLQRTMRKLDERFRWTAKPVIRSKTKGRATGGQLLGIKKNLNWGPVEE
ncbi:hypothetical protein K0M31_001801 [Melipona bicolor]|uniref:Endonuclease/exonuclease/phosphatase domain-containing protein n=1 Tax=Melipona bicolor TaxID=60889 RepID=A0AA40GGD2_9HYME|nr:hypothetical protein K0M31_001801 [Melipona bicolor]